MSDQTTNSPKVYVYAYLDPRKPGNFVYDGSAFSYEPFYVGKGSMKASKRHLHLAKAHHGENEFKERKIRRILEAGLEPVIHRVAVQNQTEACALEVKWIRTIGKGSKGPLTNIWPGGDLGPLGMKHSEETKKKMSMARKGRCFTESHKEGMRNAWKSSYKSFRRGIRNYQPVQILQGTWVVFFIHE